MEEFLSQPCAAALCPGRYKPRPCLPCREAIRSHKARTSFQISASLGMGNYTFGTRWLLEMDAVNPLITTLIETFSVAARLRELYAAVGGISAACARKL